MKVGDRMTDRGAVVMIENNKVALIKRIKGERTYYVFPGGKQEANETIEQCAKREALEELGVEVELGELCTTVPYNGTQYYFFAKIIGGVFGTGQAEEFFEPDGGTYVPMWLALHELDDKEIIPVEVVQVLKNHKPVML